MTIREYTEDAVRKYLRTVLLVDDQLFGSKCENVTRQEDVNLTDLTGVPDTAAGSVISSSALGARSRQLDEASQNPQDEAPSPETEAFSPQNVVDGFYSFGIVCGLFQPKTSEFSNGVVPSSLVDLCDHSDVFILDWKLKDNQPDSPVPVLLKQLLDKDDSLGAPPRAVRFCAIYTDELLSTVFSILNSKIYDNSSDDSKKEDLQSFQMHLNGLTIRLYRKNNRAEADGSPTRFVSSSDLAKTIVQDFVTEYEGIMSATALQGIAEVRDNAKRLLDKFPKGMNPAIVLHAGLTLKEKSIVADMSSLLGDEISSILNDMRVSPDDVYDLCAEYVNTCEENVFKRTNDNVFSGRATSATIRKFLTEVFKQKTYTPRSDDGLLERVFNKNLDNIHLLNTFKIFVERKSANAKDYMFGALSALFCQRTIYSKQKILQFGTVVRKCSANGSSSQTYYLCLMPTCDSIRLEDNATDSSGSIYPVSHRFPFWKLDFVNTEGEQKTHGLCVKAEGQYRSLCAKGKIRDKFHLMDFYSRHKVVPFDESGTLTCADGSGKLEWIAELKSSHVQRIAERVSREFSRVGLSESEWLRLQVDR